MDPSFDCVSAAACAGADTPPARDELPVLDGARVGVRGFRPADLEDFFAVHSDPAVMRYWSFPAWTELSQARERFASALSGRDAQRLLCWAITRRDDDRLIGGVTLFAIDRSQGRAEVGYSLGAAHWAHGYAREAMELVLAHAFEVLRLRRIEADIDPRNVASCTLAERLGFMREGVLRERWQVDDQLQDSAMYGLLARDWHARRT